MKGKELSKNKVDNKGIEVTDDEFASISIMTDDFHGDWNYTICRNIS
jgi:GH18 family chitinase